MSSAATAQSTHTARKKSAPMPSPRPEACEGPKLATISLPAVSPGSGAQTFPLPLCTDLFFIDPQSESDCGYDADTEHASLLMRPQTTNCIASSLKTLAIMLYEGEDVDEDPEEEPSTTNLGPRPRGKGKAVLRGLSALTSDLI
ncbi:hypothetical protein DFP72DRAFT_1077110 [Ephemerocybe angulata]|uniref:Uncharacterized protein n=1 Tax=Ephemerocybe angulata TaxID=980116 RepID=A0A8H6LYY5_9AGAR|nr:hypothetical protein DFP72DRAFT_1077110 [Tulosesus angulatus]